jgi:hypothetical protein
MSREQDLILIEKLLDASENPCLSDQNVYDEKALIESMHKAIAYGRATPDREMLVRFRKFLHIPWDDYSFHADHLKDVDEFLTLENQRGENER